MYNNFILFYPALEKGGATKILINLVNFFLKKGINIQLICLNANSHLFKDPQKKLKIIKIKNFKTKYLFKSRLLFSFASLYLLFKELIKQERKTTKVFSLQSHFVSVILSKICATVDALERDRLQPDGRFRLRPHLCDIDELAVELL